MHVEHRIAQCVRWDRHEDVADLGEIRCHQRMIAVEAAGIVSRFTQRGGARPAARSAADVPTGRDEPRG